jgi:hypothetical protein
MKIDSNVIGNYTLTSLRNINNPAKTAEVKKAAQANGITNKPEVSNDEKKFFAELYPEKKSEIMDYHFYQKSGKTSGVTKGSLFNKRG